MLASRLDPPLQWIQISLLCTKVCMFLVEDHLVVHTTHNISVWLYPGLLKITVCNKNCWETSAVGATVAWLLQFFFSWPLYSLINAQLTWIYAVSKYQAVIFWLHLALICHHHCAIMEMQLSFRNMALWLHQDTLPVPRYSSCTYIFSVADPPRIEHHPEQLKDVLPLRAVTFTVKATGTEPMSYRWWHKPAGKEVWSELQGEDSSTLSIPSAQKSNEGSYYCVVGNCANVETSKSAELSVGKNWNSIASTFWFQFQTGEIWLWEHIGFVFWIWLGSTGSLIILTVFSGMICSQ